MFCQHGNGGLQVGEPDRMPNRDSLLPDGAVLLGVFPCQQTMCQPQWKEWRYTVQETRWLCGRLMVWVVLLIQGPLPVSDIHPPGGATGLLEEFPAVSPNTSTSFKEFAGKLQA